jgi:Zn-dependent peptidase ImmA (M78 family)
VARIGAVNRVPVRPELLRWAIERSGLVFTDLEADFPKLPEWLAGEISPTFKQLEDLARTTHAPVGYLFLDEPPVERLPIPDFRTISGGGVVRPSPDLLDTLYLCQQRQDWYREFARIEGEAPLDWIGSATLKDDVVEVAARLRHSLNLDLAERKRFKTWAEAARRLIEQADDLGVLVMVSGVVGSNNRRKLDPEEFRGFALADPIAPLVFVNGSDTKSAQMFTLAHELAHLVLGQSALSDSQPCALPGQEVERWCNQVAAELLVPMEAFRTEHQPEASLALELTRLARCFKVSTLVILRRIYDAGSITLSRFREAYREELKRLLAYAKGNGGDFYLTLAVRVGKRLARALVVSTLEGRSSFTEAFRLLGFKKMTTFQELGRSLGIPA